MFVRVAGRLRRHASLVVLAFFALGGGSYAVASSVSSASAKRLYACVTSDYGTLNLSSVSARCPTGQHKISWGDGTRGPAGRAGAKGDAGAAGAKGDTGAAGTAGAKGDTGVTGPAGAAGATGAAGPQGTAGANGAPGAAGVNGIDAPANYGQVYNVGAQTVPVEADISFDTNGVLAGLTHAPGTAAITAANAGLYDVRFIVSSVEPSQFALFLNGAPIASSLYGSGAGTDQNHGEVLVTLAPGDVLTLRNHSSATPVTLQTLAGGTQTNVNASLTITALPT